ncbi:MAG TPA: hypothetical protein VK436_16705 [Methanocella sp.]|nr:hypothetical protein [Methanocella sp.]
MGREVDRGHKTPGERREEEDMRKRKKIRGNVEPVEEHVRGQAGKETFEFK